MKLSWKYCFIAQAMFARIVWRAVTLLRTVRSVLKGSMERIAVRVEIAIMEHVPMVRVEMDHVSAMLDSQAIRTVQSAKEGIMDWIAKHAKAAIVMEVAWMGCTGTEHVYAMTALIVSSDVETVLVDDLEKTVMNLVLEKRVFVRE